MISSSSDVAKRQALHIEDIVRIVVVDELPKRREDIGGGFPSMHPMWKQGVFPRVDNWNRNPGMPAALGDPSEDALIIERIWLTIDPASLDLAPYKVTHGFRLPARDAALIKLDDIVATARESLAITVYRAAVRRKAPDWSAAPHFEPVCGDMGRPALFGWIHTKYGEDKDGKPLYVSSVARNSKTNRLIQPGGVYKIGTHCKLNWVVGAEDAFEARVEYALRHALLTRLYELLHDARKTTIGPDGAPREVPLLDGFTVRPPSEVATPWITPEAPARVLMATASRWVPRVARREPLDEPTRPSHGPVRQIPIEEYAAAA